MLFRIRLYKDNITNYNSKFNNIQFQRIGDSIEDDPTVQYNDYDFNWRFSLEHSTETVDKLELPDSFITVDRLLIRPTEETDSRKMSSELLNTVVKSKAYKRIGGLEFSSLEMGSITLSPFIKEFRYLKSLQLNSLTGISLESICQLVSEIPLLVSLLLQSTPCTYSETKFDSLLDLVKTSTSLLSFSIFSYFMSTSKHALIDLINTTQTIQNLCICNIDKTIDIMSFEIINQSIKHLYVDNNAEEFIKSWVVPSSITSIQLNEFSAIECELVKLYYNKSLETIRLVGIKDNSVCDLIKSNLPFTSFNCSPEYSALLNWSDFANSFKSNNVIKECYFESVKEEFILDFLRLQLPNIQFLSFTTTNETCKYFEKDLTLNTTLTGLSIDTKHVTFEETFECTIEIINHCKQLVDLSMPASTTKPDSGLTDNQKEQLTKSLSTNRNFMDLNFSKDNIDPDQVEIDIDTLLGNRALF
ncbi:hypothetical protein DLAC_01786 [Tieghemostelium lacteum]|uniref:Uncharacterized protein n=1 Tax=Tieghemostelium lacteum TaxID=361077 RepID=A0A152A6B3_TIELA|nr:hypothetical protein DLAC_01786 [Tieghemostelium lacteum]|eukprot:KYR01774.1 hypothetical protein DLAC_01786 [Tieghemostelium lacteum]